ncbi:MAG: sodium/proton-translocating pyrophosphatase, partial [Fimbriimonadaceae bacterium]
MLQFGPLRYVKRLLGLLMAAFILMLPMQAFAAGKEVPLIFNQAQSIYLYISIAFGLLALFYGWYLSRWVLSRSAGNDKMQAIGLSIRQGALAYLKKQASLMGVFVLLLAVGLVMLYGFNRGWDVGVKVALCLILGVAASYLAGYAGMIMAVAGNMRTAHAAMSSYKDSLEVAFRSGAVAGMVTVGMGLIGAAGIILVEAVILGKPDAMTLLIGFGLGGSLAALFMRVGGGIFTKAADVGADLVGKVEAGIPEDDPRNPATIADNVGDNVGDCAGMAADIFESYEVTLVAAIVLGAATAALFDTSTWMMLILFALMARGVGIIASIIGVGLMKGSDDLHSDPLKSISRGFNISAVVTVVLTGLVAWYMMGGAAQLNLPGAGQPIVTYTLTPPSALQWDQQNLVREVVLETAAREGVSVEEVTVEQVASDPRIVAAGLTDERNAFIFEQLVRSAPSPMAPRPSLSGFAVVDLNDPSSPVAGLSIRPFPSSPADEAVAQPIAFADAFRDAEPMVYKLSIINQPTPSEGERPEAAVNTAFFGPVTRAYLDALIAQVEEMNEQNEEAQITVTIDDEFPVLIFANAEGEIVYGVDAPVTAEEPINPIVPQVMSYWKLTPEQLQERMQKVDLASIPQTNAQVAVTSPILVPWWTFFLCLVFGVIMAFVMERLTDYYVSTHKRPVQEVAGVSTAGPAPMIIQGFSFAAESSVFSLLAIVVALITPLIIFNPAAYDGSYLLSFYGIALVGLGLLSTTGYILAMDTFGPISDNAQGVFEMSGAAEESGSGARIVQHLDAAGNTTKALTKGFAIATAVVAAVALFHSYVEAGELTFNGLRLDIPEIFLGLLIGGATPFLFAASTINAVGRSSFELINEVRRQFRENPGIMTYQTKPDYGRCVAIVTAAAQKELIGPAILAIALPVAVGFGFTLGAQPTMVGNTPLNLAGAQALGGFLAGAILSGQLMAVLLANSGGIWDNSKKLIEDGLYGGKGSEAHKAGVV